MSVCFRRAPHINLRLHPLPDLAGWAEVVDASERSVTALTAMYCYYRQIEMMWSVVYRDVDQLESLQVPMARFEAYLDQVSDDLVTAWNETNTAPKLLQATLRHALQHAKLTDKKIADLVQNWLVGIGKVGSA